MTGRVNHAYTLESAFLFQTIQLHNNLFICGFIFVILKMIMDFIYAASVK